jgi:hypothetical protein
MKRFAFLSCLAATTLLTSIGALAIVLPAEAAPPTGKVIYSADFSKWDQSGSSLTFKDGAYVIDAAGRGQHLILGPKLVHPAEAVTLRASLGAGATKQSGFGIYCLADDKKVGYSFSFLVQRNGGWAIWEQHGSQPIETLASGSVRDLAVTNQNSVTAVCDVSPHSRNVTVGLYVDGQKVSLLTQRLPLLTKPWLTAIDVYSNNSSPTTIKAKSFVIRSWER